MVIYIIPAAPKVSNASCRKRKGGCFRSPDRSCFLPGVHHIPPGDGMFPDFLVPPMPSLMSSHVPSVVPIASPASTVPIAVPEIRPIIWPIIRRINALIDRIWRRDIGGARVVVGSGSPYRNAERWHNHRKTDDRPRPIPGVRLVGDDCQQKSEGQDRDQYCRKEGLHLSPPSPYQALFALLD